MFIHVGIEPYDGELSYYNETEKKIVNLKVTSVKENEIEKVNLMFEEIKAKINEEYGFLCIYLNRGYENEIRNKFIKEGLKIGFKNVEIINQETARYLNAMSKIKYKPLNGNIIWIYWFNSFSVWKINDKKANFIGVWKADPSKLNELQKIVNESKLEKGPDIVLSDRNIDETNVRKISADCNFFGYNLDSYRYSNASLLKARITFGDSDLSHLDTQQFLSDTITLKIGDKEIASVEIGEKLPIIFTQKIKKESKNDDLEIQFPFPRDVIKLPEQENITINFHIDINQIYSVEFIPPKVIYINQKNVIIYDSETQNLTLFLATIDYGSDDPKIGVNYRGETVLTEIIKNFGKISCDNIIPIRQISSAKGIKRRYVLKIGKNEHFVDEEKVVVDLFEEAIKKSGISKENIFLIIPTHFSTRQKTAYLKAAKIAGFTDIISVDEKVALAFGYENQENGPTPDTEYLLINFCDTVIKITVNKAGDFDKGNCPSKIIDCSNFESKKLSFFDKIINEAAAENEFENDNFDNFELWLQTLLDEINEMISNVTNLTTIVITENNLVYAFLRDHFPAPFQIILVENSEELIFKGAVLA